MPLNRKEKKKIVTKAFQDAASRKKISVKHFLNKKIKDERTGKSPVYVRVIFDRKKTEFRSNYPIYTPKKLQDLYLSEKEFNEPSDDITVALWCEYLVVYDVVDYFRENGKNLIVEGNVPETIFKYSGNLRETVDNHYRDTILKLLTKNEDLRFLLDAIDNRRLSFKRLQSVLNNNLLPKYVKPEISEVITQGTHLFKVISRINERLNKDNFFFSGKLSYLLDRKSYPDEMRIIHWKNKAKRYEINEAALRRCSATQEDLALVDQALDRY